jgi:glycosyltransferase involved in cell wall biosynthesis
MRAESRVLSIVVPAYNEERYIGRLLERIFAVPTEQIGFAKEVIVVDDGSTDATAAITKRFASVKLIQQKNAGKGNAVRAGIRHATGDFILVQDADLEYDPSDYVLLLSAAQLSPPNCVYGSRPWGIIQQRGWRWPLPGKHENQGVGPWAMNLVLMALTFLLYGRIISDMLTAYKLYPAKIVQEFRTITNGFETDHEITARLIRSNVAIVEVPISYSPRTSEEGKKIRAIDGIIAVWTLLRFRCSR